MLSELRTRVPRPRQGPSEELCPVGWAGGWALPASCRLVLPCVLLDVSALPRSKGRNPESTEY